MGVRLTARRVGNVWKSTSELGQMTVELAIAIPVALAVMGIVVNLMVFLGDCARFDRLAAEAVRINAASPSYSSYGTQARAQAVKSLLETSLGDRSYLSVAVSVESILSDDAPPAEGVSLPMLPHQERYICVLNYTPWGLGDSFFGISFSGIEHTRSYVIDPFKPGVFL